MANFYYADHIQDKIAVISRDLHHILNVARHQKGESIGIIYPPYRGTGKIAEISKEKVVVELDSVVKIVKPEIRVSVAIPVIKDLYFKELLHSLVELEIEKIYIFKSRRSNRKLGWLKMDRLYKLLVEASKQCGNPLPPEVEFTEMEAIHGNGFFMDIDGNDFQSYNPVRGENIIVVGPEGGFTPEEKKLLESGGLKPVAFGREVLRTQAAVISAVSVSKFLWKSFNEEVPLLRI